MNKCGPLPTGCLCVAILCMVAVADEYPKDIPANPPESDEKSPLLPNVIVILADDLGPGDLGAYNNLEGLGRECQVPTPAMDRLAVHGMRFVNAHASTSLCAPTRNAIITGRNAWHCQPVWNMGGTVFDSGVMSLGDVMQKAEYRTAFLGKQHLGGSFYRRDSDETMGANWKAVSDVDFERPIKDGLQEHGFDYSLGLAAGIQDAPYLFIQNGLPVQMMDDGCISPITNADAGTQLTYWRNGTHRNGQVEVYQPGWGSATWNTMKVPQHMAQHAVNFMDQSVTEHGDAPFFMFYASVAVHVPHVPDTEITVTLPGDDEPRTWKVDGYHGRGEHPDDAGTPLMRMVNTFDIELAILMAYLEKTNDPRRPGHKLIENTMIILTSDNGGIAWGEREEVRPEWTDYRHDPTSGLRDRKGSIWEGGHRVPFLVFWEGHVPENTVREQLIGTHDLMGTLMALTRQNLPDQGRDSFNMLPVFLGTQDDTNPVRDFLLVGHNVGQGKLRGYALYMGSWKLIMASRGNSEADALGLFNLEEDPTEQNDLRQSKNPDHRRQLAKMVERYAAQRADQ